MYRPIWVLLVLSALATQWLLVYFLGEQAQTGELAISVLGWTCLYGFCVSAAALAGEREAGTLFLLDALPADRFRLWLAKVSFALASTLGLGLLLLLAAAASTRQWTNPPFLQGLGVGSLSLLVVLGTGFFWSSVTGSALLAAVLAVFSALMSLPLLDVGLRWRLGTVESYVLTLVTAVLAFAASALAFVRLGPPRRPLPLALVLRRSAAEEVRRRSEAAPASREGRPTRMMTGRSAAYRLAWQALRQARPLGWLALIALAVPFVLYAGLSRPVTELWVLTGALMSLAAGVSVFGADGRARTQVFLAAHGVRPGLVWTVRILVWLAVLAAFWGLTGVLQVRTWTIARAWASEAFGSAVVLCGAIFLSGFALSALCGMVFRRGITAGAVSVLLAVLLVPGLFALRALGMLSDEFALLVPLALLAVGLGWSREWLLDQSGARRWIKLAALAAGTFALLFGGHVAHRIASVPTLDPALEARMLHLAAPVILPAGVNAADIYLEEARKVSPQPSGAQRVIREGWDARARESSLGAWYRDNVARLEPVRKAAALPVCRLTPLENTTIFGYAPHESISPLTTLLALSVRDRQQKGDMDGAWDDLMVLFQMARQTMQFGVAYDALTGLSLEQRALGLAMIWAADPRQTPERLRAASERLSPPPSAAELIRTQAQVYRNTEQLSHAELVERALEAIGTPRKAIKESDKLWVDLVTTPWEMARFRRAWRLLLAVESGRAELDAWHPMRSQASLRRSWLGAQVEESSRFTPVPIMFQEVLQTTPLLMHFHISSEYYLRAWDRNEAARRALTQIFALRSWQIRHQGKLPHKLEELVSSGEIAALPVDPYTPGSPFGWVRSSGQPLLPLGDLEPLPNSERVERLRPAGNAWLLYSVGPDLKDDSARGNDRYDGGGDIIFPLAESTGGNSSARQDQR